MSLRSLQKLGVVVLYFLLLGIPLATQATEEATTSAEIIEATATPTLTESPTPETTTIVPEPTIAPEPTPTTTATPSPSPILPTIIKTQPDTTDPVRYQPPKEKPQPQEITNLRTQHAKAYAVEPAEIQAHINSLIKEGKLNKTEAEKLHQNLATQPLIKYEIAPAPIHYQDGTIWREINSNIVRDEITESGNTYHYRNAGGNFTFRAAEHLFDGVSYQSNDGKLCQFKLSGVTDADGKVIELQNATAQLSDNILTYPNIYPDADLKFSLNATGVQTEIIAKTPTARQSTYTFDLLDCQIKPQQATMTDGNKQVPVEEKLETREKELILINPETQDIASRSAITVDELVIKPDYSQLNPEGEIRIDPSFGEPVQLGFVASNVPSAVTSNKPYLVVGDKTVEYFHGYEFCGNHPIYHRYYHDRYASYSYSGPPESYLDARAFVRYDLSSILSLHDNNIISASLHIPAYELNATTDNNTVNCTVPPAQLIARKIVSDWQPNTISYPGPASVGNYGSGVFRPRSRDEGNNITLDRQLIVELKQAQAHGTNYGIAIESGNGHGMAINMYRQIGNLEEPKLQIYTYANIPNESSCGFSEWNPGRDLKSIAQDSYVHNSQAHCDESATPAQGTCRTVVEVPLDPGYAPHAYQKSVGVSMRSCDQVVHQHEFINARGNLIVDLSRASTGWNPPIFPGFSSLNGNRLQIDNPRNSIWLGDGEITWRVNTQFQNGSWYGWSNPTHFFIDTTPPTAPAFTNPNPEQGPCSGIDCPIQAELWGNTTSDNLAPYTQLKYRVRYSANPNFPVGETFISGWLPGDPGNSHRPHMQIAHSGVDQILGTPDDLVAGTYYFQLGAQDVVGNISGWSPTKQILYDVTPPAIDSYSVDKLRFSPGNTTSVGIADSVTVDLTYTEAKPKQAQLEVHSSMGNRVRSIVVDQSNLNDAVAVPVSLSWDGRDDGGTLQPDGAYTLTTTVLDQAGNPNQFTASTNNPRMSTVILDDSPAAVTVTSYRDGFFIGEGAYLDDDHGVIELAGQVKLPHVPDHYDDDLAGLSLYKINLEGATTPLELSWDANDIFTSIQTVTPEQNEFILRTVDTVGNTGEHKIRLYYETDAPAITEISPSHPDSAPTNNLRPVINFKLTDAQAASAPTQSLLAHENIDDWGNPAAAPQGLRIWLEYDLLDTTQPLPYPYLNPAPSKILIHDQQIASDATGLVGALTCEPDTGALGLATGVHNDNPVASHLVCALPFVADLAPDATYTIHVESQDIAGNIAKSSQAFVLDTHVHSQLETVKSGGRYSQSHLLYQGVASEDSLLMLKQTTLNREVTVRLDQALDGQGKHPAATTSQSCLADSDCLVMAPFDIDCNHFADIDSRPETPNERVCQWSTRLLQQYNPDHNVDIDNQSLITVTDRAGNMQTKTINYSVNLFDYDLEIDTDLAYFSPDGNGKQDGIVFSHSATNPTDPLNQPEISSYTLTITNQQSGQLVRSFLGVGSLPAHTVWDGRNSEGAWVSDGNYVYTLEITTTDGVTRTVPAPARTLQAVTQLDDSLVITSPKTGLVTTYGVITLQGQAPTAQPREGESSKLLRGDVTIDVCVNLQDTPNLQPCDLTTTIEADEAGFFSSLLVLPRLPGQARTHHIITAVASDRYGNQTPNSNLVEVIVDTVDPFSYVGIVPVFTGVTNGQAYAEFLAGERNMSEIVALKLTAQVSQGTRAVGLAFDSYNNVAGRSDQPNFQSIGTLTDQVESDSNLNPHTDPAIKKRHMLAPSDAALPQVDCANAAGCTWSSYLPVPPEWGGVYEVEFAGYKGDVVQRLSAGFKVDGTIPQTPTIMMIEKQVVCSQLLQVQPQHPTCHDNPDKIYWERLDDYMGNFYSNATVLRVQGVATAGS